MSQQRSNVESVTGMDSNQSVQAWIQELIGPFQAKPMQGDAGLRRYDRLYAQTGAQQFVCATYPNLQSSEDSHWNNFLSVQAFLHFHEVPVPTVIAANKNLGTMILEDLGETLYLDALRNQDFEQANQLYRQAAHVLLKLYQANHSTPPLTGMTWPIMDKHFLWKQYQLFEDWYVVRHLHQDRDCASPVKMVYAKMVEFIERLPKVIAHMDYHSRNIVYDPQHKKIAGILDFQDAMWAPITYDIASLLKDCYINWPRYEVLDWLLHFRDDLASVGLIDRVFRDGEWVKAFDWVGLQRHIKVLGIFARLKYRDGKPEYLESSPRIFDYIFETTQIYQDLEPLQEWFQKATLTCA